MFREGVGGEFRRTVAALHLPSLHIPTVSEDVWRF
jgi:hypothetical protein